MAISEIEMNQTYAGYLSVLRASTKPVLTKAETKDYAKIAHFINESRDKWNSKATIQIASSLEGIANELNSLPGLVNSCIDKSNTAFDSLLPALTDMEKLIESYNANVGLYNAALSAEQAAAAAAAKASENDGGVQNV